MWFDGIGRLLRTSNNIGQTAFKGILSAKIKCSLTMLMLLVSVGGGQLFAQTDLPGALQSGDKNAQYQEELDKWMLQAYEGNNDAQFKVGVLFTNKEFNTPDYEQAAYWYQQAAERGHVLAQFNLGHQYLTGQGVPRDEKIAMSWWLKAAEQDHGLASFNVGRGYYLGIGLQEDHELARYWFERAAQNKEPKSIDILEKLGWAEKGQYTAAEVDQPASSIQRQTSTLASNGAVSSDDAGTRAATVSARSPSNTKAPAAVTPSTKGLTAVADNTSTASATPAAQQVSSENTNAATEVAKPITAVPSASNESVSDTESNPPEHPLAIYTNPAKRSVLITIVDKRDGLNIVERSSDWLIVTLDTGLPVWVHSNFINVNGSKGVVTGSNVNARSVPLISSGTVVGQLNKQEKVDVLDQKDEWYRVQSPTRFRGWAKRSEYNNPPAIESEAKTVSATPPASTAQATTNVQTNTTGNLNEADVNEWLFAQSEDNLTMQLASFDDPAKTAQFASERKFKDDKNLRQLTSIRAGIEWTYFLYGNYKTREEAENAKTEINQKRAWIRSFGRLQENRCLSWKQQIPAPRELNKYCVQ